MSLRIAFFLVSALLTGASLAQHDAALRNLAKQAAGGSAAASTEIERRAKAGDLSAST